MYLKLNGLDVCVDEIQFENCPEDSFVISAHYVANDEQLDDDALDELQDEAAELIYEAWTENAIGRAESMADAAQDR